MNFSINPGQAKAWLTFLIGLGAAGYAAYQAQAHTGSASWTAVAAAVILGVERYVSDPTTGNPSATRTSTPPKPTIPPR